jgi:hypothetical protein
MAEIDDRMMGVGCFGAPRTLSRVLGRVMESYSLGGWKDALARAPDDSEGVVALQRLMGVAGGPGSADERVAGFFLGFKGRRLHLSVFTRGRGTARRNYTASLEELTCLRRRRLN